MKASTTASILLGVMSASSTSSATTPYPEPVKSQAEYTTEAGVTFRATRFDDGRSTPYRIYFWDKHITGSSYRLSEEGHVVYFKAGEEVYYDRAEKDDGSLVFQRKEATNGGKHSSNMLAEVPFDCDSCTADLAAVCYTGLPKFCEDIDADHLGHEGVYSVGILCGGYEELCSAFQQLCDSICVAEVEQSPTCTNDFVGIEGSNGACCVAGCGQCGGVGCSRFGNEIGLTADDCCSTEIVDEGKPCYLAGAAPCFIDGSSGDVVADAGDVVADAGDDGNDDNLWDFIEGTGCNVDTLAEATRVGYMEPYELDLYIEPLCVEPAEHVLPNGCNFMGLGQGCRSCFKTCDGALAYMKAFEVEISEKTEDVIINFCDGYDYSDVQDCPGY
eukprot:g7572.t1